jgi:Ca-activated chloride channel family protein
MSFDFPLALVALVAVPVLVALYVLHERRRRAEGARFATVGLLPNLLERVPSWRRHLPVAILLVALAAMVVGVARPRATVSVPRKDATVVLALDVSRSMNATDIRPSRLQAAKAAAAKFLADVPKTFRVGIVAIGSNATVVLPPTTDRTLARNALAALRRSEGTVLGDAVALSVDVGRKQRTSAGEAIPTSVLVISDGADQGSRVKPQAAAARARTAHIPVYTVLVGTPNGVVQHELPGGYKETIRVPPSPQTLQMIATTTGGQFFQAASEKQLRSVYENLGSRLGHKRQSREITDFFAGGAGLLLLIGVCLSVLWFRRVA